MSHPYVPKKEPGENDRLERAYVKMRLAVIDIEVLLDDPSLFSQKQRKRLDKAVTVIKVGMKIVKLVLKSLGFTKLKENITQNS